MAENGEPILDDEIESLRDLKKRFLSRMNESNKKDVNYWTRQIDKEIRKKLKSRDQL